MTASNVDAGLVQQVRTSVATELSRRARAAELGGTRRLQRDDEIALARELRAGTGRVDGCNCTQARCCIPGWGCGAGTDLFAYEEQAAAGVASAGCDHADLRWCRDLAVARFAPHLRGSFVQKSVAVQAAARQLPAVGVERQLAVPRDAGSALDEGAALTDAA
jgi:hypothetical protein